MHASKIKIQSRRQKGEAEWEWGSSRCTQVLGFVLGDVNLSRLQAEDTALCRQEGTSLTPATTANISAVPATTPADSSLLPYSAGAIFHSHRGSLSCLHRSDTLYGRPSADRFVAEK